MRTTLLLATLLCLLLFADSALAQRRGQMGFDRTESILRSEWSGQRTFSSTWGLLSSEDSGVRIALNISDEQYQQIQEANHVSFTDDPEMEKNYHELFQLQMQTDRDANSADEETINRMKELEDIVFDWAERIRLERLDAVLTPEQEQKIAEIKLVAIGETPLVSPHVFDPLGLTDAQKQHMERIKKELEPEFEKNLEILLNGRKILSEKWADEWDAEYERQGGDEALTKLVMFDEKTGLSTREANREKMDALIKTIHEKMTADAEYKSIQNEMNTSGKAFASQLRVKMFDVLTDEQWVRFQKLIDNPPEHAKAYLKEVRKWQGEAEKSGEWLPGPTSWRPGDPIPEQYRQERNTRRGFPREE